jgi:hypothetical protein
MNQLAKHLAAFLAVLLWSAPTVAQTTVDTALVLAVDASGSIDEAEFRLQKEGIALAVTDKRVLAAVQSGPLQRIAIAYVEWGGPGMAQTVVDWAIVDDQGSAQAFAQAVLAAPRSVQSYNAIGDVLVHATALLQNCPCEPTRAVIDVSGDNPDNRSIVPAPAARDAAADAGITINALAILQTDALGPSGRPLLVENYESEVIAGPGAFVIAAQDRSDFARALLQKMVLEIANLMPAQAALTALRR